MHVRLVLITAASLVSSSAFAADHSKPAAPSQASAQPAPVRVVLASADDIRSPVQAEQQASATPKRPRIARVTSCRCGDQPPQPEQ